MVEGTKTIRNSLNFLLGQGFRQLVHSLDDIFQINLIFVVTGLNHVYGNAGNYAVKMFLLIFHKVLHTR